VRISICGPTENCRSDRRRRSAPATSDQFACQRTSNALRISKVPGAAFGTPNTALACREAVSRRPRRFRHPFWKAAIGMRRAIVRKRCARRAHAAAAPAVSATHRAGRGARGDLPDSQRGGSQPAQSINFLIDHDVASFVFLSAFPQQGAFNTMKDSITPLQANFCRKITHSRRKASQPDYVYSLLG